MEKKKKKRKIHLYTPLLREDRMNNQLVDNRNYNRLTRLKPLPGIKDKKLRM